MAGSREKTGRLLNHSADRPTQPVPIQQAVTDGKLASAAVAGDKQAFESLAARHWERIFRLVYYRVNSRPDAEDLTQEVFIKALRKLKKLKEPDKFGSWLSTIAVNSARDFHRKRKFLVFLGGSDEAVEIAGQPEETKTDPTALKKLEKKEFWLLVRGFTNTLPVSEKEVFMLRFMDQLSLVEIARVLGRSQSTIKTHLYRALEKLRGRPGLLALLKEERS